MTEPLLPPLPKTKHPPWKPTLSSSIEQQPANQTPPTVQPNTSAVIPGNIADPVHEHDPSLEEVAASLLKMRGGKYSTARQQRFIARHLTPKAKARKKVARRQQRQMHKQHPSSRGSYGNDA